MLFDKEIIEYQLYPLVNYLINEMDMPDFEVRGDLNWIINRIDNFLKRRIPNYKRIEFKEDSVVILKDISYDEFTIYSVDYSLIEKSGRYSELLLSFITRIFSFESRYIDITNDLLEDDYLLDEEEKEDNDKIKKKIKKIKNAIKKCRKFDDIYSEFDFKNDTFKKEFFKKYRNFELNFRYSSIDFDINFFLSDLIILTDGGIIEELAIMHINSDMEELNEYIDSYNSIIIEEDKVIGFDKGIEKQFEILTELINDFNELWRQ